MLKACETCLLLATTPLWVWALLAVLLVAILTLPRRLARRSNILEDPNRKRSAEEQLRRSMDRLLIELQETAREINATIDTKMIALNRLIEEADRRIEKLEGPSVPPAETPDTAGSETEEEPSQSPAKKRLTKDDDAPDTPAARRRRRLEKRIYKLADEGKDMLEIARITDTPRGEVELILSLRRIPDDDGGTS
jgi:hypothetical protein